MRKRRKKAGRAGAIGGKRKDDRAFGNPLSEQLHAIEGDIRLADTRREKVREHARDLPVEKAPLGDADLFRDATAGVRSLSSLATRVALPPGPAARKIGSLNAKPLDPTADEHFDIRFSDLYVRGRAAGVSRETLAKLARGEFAVRSHVDLHGMALDDAKEAVDRFLVEHQKRGDRCVLVITGKGRNSRGQVAVLRERIPEWLARGPSARRVLAFVTARPCDGGEGAFYVLLRKDVSRKMRIDVDAGGGKE